MPHYDPNQREILPGRWVADPPPGITLVIFGLRVNRWRAIWSWLPLWRSLRSMLREAEVERESSGLLWATQWRDDRMFTVLSYWSGYDAAMSWAQDGRFHHVSAWGRYNRGRVGDSGDVGLWHEVIEIDSGRVHTLYRDVDLRGLAAATSAEPADAAHLRRHKG